MPNIPSSPIKEVLFNASKSGAAALNTASRVKLPPQRAAKIKGALASDVVAISSSTDSKLIRLYKSCLRDNPRCRFSTEANGNFVRFLNEGGQEAKKEELMIKLSEMARTSKEPLKITEFTEGYYYCDHLQTVEGYFPKLTINGKTYEAWSGPNPQNYDTIKCFNEFLDQANKDINPPNVAQVQKAKGFWARLISKFAA